MSIKVFIHHIIFLLWDEFGFFLTGFTKSFFVRVCKLLILTVYFMGTFKISIYLLILTWLSVGF